MILVTDSHVSTAKGNADEFFAMLDHVAKTRHDIIFLGDILDLWIALPPFETEIHERFLKWCRTQKQQRVVGFVEGNHEFFAHQSHPDAFTFCAPLFWQDDFGTLFCHGDLIDRQDKGYRLFRILTKNWLTKQLLRWLPGAPALAAMVKRNMNSRTHSKPKDLPENEIRHFANDQFKSGVKHILCGHFHGPFSCADDQGDTLHVIPKWEGSGRVGLCEGTDTPVITSWRDVN